MCGIVGRIGPAPVTEAEILQMCEAIRHRGPDDWGTFVEGGVGLGVRRLSIIDLAGGHQPIANEDGTVVIVFNGEIYNHQALHRELEARGHRFRTRTGVPCWPRGPAGPNHSRVRSSQLPTSSGSS